MSRISKTHRRDVAIGDCYTDRSEFRVRLWADEWGDGTIGWVDFEIFEVIGHDAEGDRRKFFNRKDSDFSPDPVYDYDEAETVADGFVKWDGCTQFTVAPVHVDDRESLRLLFAAIEKARELAAELMPSKMIAEEYWDATGTRRKP